MSLPEVFRLFAYLKDNPSQRQLVAVIATMLGWKPPAQAAAEKAASRPPTIAELKALYPDGIMRG